MGSFFGSQAAHAGIPVIDAANLAQAIQQVISWQQQYSQMVQQYQQLQTSYQSITGARGLGDILNNPLLQGVVPADVATVFNGINQGGYSGLTSAAQGLRNAAMKYNCEDRTGDARVACEAVLNTNSQAQAYQQNALQLITQRVQQIQSLQSQINTTQDPKAIAELQARIAAENTQVTNDANRIQVMQALAQSQQAAAEQQQRERWLNVMRPTTPTAASTFVYQPPQ
ncbi:MAG: P-type DNA transfer protein VirB5 [Burkholderiaceae bacterium]|nr:P-type DNA transfer protein VirB5 [Burkholderiaceae bacterium]